MSDTAQRFLDTLSDGRSSYGETIYTIVDKNGDDVSLTRDVLRHWAALEAQAPAVAELVRAARALAVLTEAHGRDVHVTNGALHVDLRWIQDIQRSLEPFKEVDR